MDAFVRKVAQAALPTESGSGFSLSREINLPTGIAGTTSGSDSIPHEIVGYAVAFAQAYHQKSDDVQAKADELHGALLVAMTIRLLDEKTVYELVDDLDTLMEKYNHGA